MPTAVNSGSIEFRPEVKTCCAIDETGPTDRCGFAAPCKQDMHEVEGLLQHAAAPHEVDSEQAQQHESLSLMIRKNSSR